MHYLGDAAIKTKHIKDEKRMKSLSYQIETMKYNFEKYTTAHCFYHNQINVANSAIYSPQLPLLERIKVQNFLTGIEAPLLVVLLVEI